MNVMVVVPLFVFFSCGFVLLCVVFFFSLSWLPGVVSRLYGRYASVLFLGFGGCFVLRLVFRFIVASVVFVWCLVACFLVLLWRFIFGVAFLFCFFYSKPLVIAAAIVSLCYVAPRSASVCPFVVVLFVCVMFGFRLPC